MLQHKLTNQHRDQICGQDYSHSWVTDVGHCLDIYQYAKDYAGQCALEVGSFFGHGTLALSLAGLDLRACDPDINTLPQRQNLCPNVQHVQMTGEQELAEPGTYAVIFHDSYHGEAVVPELVRYWKNKLDQGGLLIVHDVNEFNLSNFLAAIGNPPHRVTADNRGRTLGMFWKPERLSTARNNLVFVTSCDAKFAPGARGLVRSIRKFHGNAVDIIIMFSGRDQKFAQFCTAHNVELLHADAVNDWLPALVHQQPRFRDDTTHAHHPDFTIQPEWPQTPILADWRAGNDRIHYTHPLNCKSYVLLYAAAVKRYAAIFDIDCDAFLLAPIDKLLSEHSAPNTIIGFDDGSDELKGLPIYGVPRPESFDKAAYAFNAGVVLFQNGPGVTDMLHEFAFYCDSPYHWNHSGYFADQGILRALTAARHIQGKINFKRLERTNWNPSWFVAEDLELRGTTWINKRNNQPQFIWHGAGGEKLWTGKYKSPSVNAAWKWIGGEIVKD